jgi:hypothetical protein
LAIDRFRQNDIGHSKLHVEGRPPNRFLAGKLEQKLGQAVGGIRIGFSEIVPSVLQHLFEIDVCVLVDC